MSRIDTLLSPERLTLNIAASDDAGTTVRADWNANDLDKLIKNLIAMRARMIPEFERQLVSDGNFDATIEPAIYVGMNTDLGVLMHTLNKGTGWLHWLMGPEQAAELGKTLRQQAKKVPEDAGRRVGEMLTTSAQGNQPAPPQLIQPPAAANS